MCHHQPPPLSCRGGDVVKFVLHLAEAIKQALQRDFLLGWEGTAGQGVGSMAGNRFHIPGGGVACLPFALPPQPFPQPSASLRRPGLRRIVSHTQSPQGPGPHVHGQTLIGPHSGSPCSSSLESSSPRARGWRCCWHFFFSPPP